MLTIVSLMVTGIAAKSNNLKPSSHKDILGFFIVSQNFFDISRRNLISENFDEFSYCSANISFIHLNESLLNMKKFKNF
jgi:hypothetical protein